ncbi:MAG: ABC transporter permease, partial [Clostridia bacterium]|nr:ABC transporter permease [Clostridia bacterium]
MLAFLVSAIRLGMVFLFGSTGEILTEKSGHLNLGTPGVMCVGASCGCFAEYMYLKSAGPYASPLVAILVAIIATFVGAALMGLLFSFLTVTLRANQNVTGLALTTLGIGISDYMIAKAGTSFGRASKFFTKSLPFADDLGWFGELFFSHGVMIYLAIAVALVCSF